MSTGRHAPIAVVTGLLTLVSALLLLPRPAFAGGGSPGYGLVRLDHDATDCPASGRRFAKFRAAMTKATRHHKSEDHEPLVLLDTEAFRPHLRPGCVLDLPRASFETLLGARDLSGVFLYCSSGDRPILTIAYYDRSFERAAAIELRPHAGQVGRPVLSHAAHTLVSFADTLFSP